jgi:hypothetical protein
VFFPTRDVLHIPNGTQLVEIPEARMAREDAKASLGLDPDKQIVLMASVDLAQAHKGTDLGISAIRQLDQRNKVQVLPLGGSSTLVKKSLEPLPTVCLSASDDAILARAYRASDVSVIPLASRQFPLCGPGIPGMWDSPGRLPDRRDARDLGPERTRLALPHDLSRGDVPPHRQPVV